MGTSLVQVVQGPAHGIKIEQSLYVLTLVSSLLLTALSSKYIDGAKHTHSISINVVCTLYSSKSFLWCLSTTQIEVSAIQFHYIVLLNDCCTKDV